MTKDVDETPDLPGGPVPVRASPAHIHLDQRGSFLPGPIPTRASPVQDRSGTTAPSGPARAASGPVPPHPWPAPASPGGADTPGAPSPASPTAGPGGTTAPPDLRFDPSGAAYVLDPSRPVLAHGRDLAAGAHVAPHAHPRGQLLWAAEGLLRLSAEDGVWLVPPGFAIWIPGGTRHEMRVVSRPGTGARTRNLYVDPSRRLRPGARGCEVLPVPPLLREVILRMVDEPDPDRQARLGAVALDEIAAARPAPLDLPGGQDPRLRRLTAYLGQNPADPRPLPALAVEAGASPRTLERLFRAETGLTFRDWRLRLRLLAAVGRLERGESSTTIAHSLGWRSTSAFVAAFRGHFGTPPQSWRRGGGQATG